VDITDYEGSTNTVYAVFPAPEDFDYVVWWDETNQTFDFDHATVYFLGAWVFVSARLNPGEGAFYYTSRYCPRTVVLSGTERVPVLPVSFVRGRYRLLSRQVPGPGTYENIVGLPPEAGSRFIRHDGDLQQWNTNVFDGSTWSLGTPTADVAEAVLIYFPLIAQPLVLTNLVYNPADGGSFAMQIIGTSNVPTRVEYSTKLTSTNWITATNHAPPTGTFTYTTNGIGASGHRFYRALYSF
jgi:hypothetical protein